MMDINDLRVLFTLVTFAAFLAILWWAFSGKRKTAFDEAALLPFMDDDVPQTGAAGVQAAAPAVRHQ